MKAQTLTLQELEEKIEQRKPHVVFDLDGTLYDSLDLSVDSLNDALKECGYFPVSKEAYKELFQTRDWNKFYSDLGVKGEDISKVIDSFHSYWSRRGPPKIIDCAKDLLQFLEHVLGKGHIHFITNEKKENVTLRFERDDLENYLAFVASSDEGKARCIYDLACEFNSSQVIYIGDLVSDGEECLAAREMGALNVYFYGLTHACALNAPQMMSLFVQCNSTYCKTLGNLRQIAFIAFVLKNRSEINALECISIEGEIEHEF